MTSETEIFKGRPADKRIPKEERVYDLLDSLGIEYYRADHAPAATIEELRPVKEKLGVKVCKNLFLCNRSKTQFYLLSMLGDKNFKTSEVSSQIGSSRLSFADEEYMEEFLDTTPGSVSILGLMNDKAHKVKLLVDKDLPKDEWFGCHPCINTSSLKIKTSDVFEKILPFLEREPKFVEIGTI